MSPRASHLLACCPTPEVRLFNGQSYKYTVFHDVYNPQVGYTLSASPLGALAHLSLEENPSLLDIKQAYGELSAIMLLFPHVSALNAASSASNRMDAPAVMLCCRDIVHAFYYLNIAEFCVFCLRMRSLKYVTRRSDYVFGSDTIMQGLNEFIKDLNVERRSYERDNQSFTPSPDAMSHDAARKTEAYKRTYEQLMKQSRFPQGGEPSPSPSSPQGGEPSPSPSFPQGGEPSPSPSLPKNVHRLSDYL